METNLNSSIGARAYRMPKFDGKKEGNVKKKRKKKEEKGKKDIFLKPVYSMMPAPL